MKPRGTSEKWHILAHVDPQYDWQNHWKDQLANIQAAFNEAKRLGIKPKNVKLVLDKGDVENDPNKDMLFSSSKKTWAQMLYYFYDFMEQELSAMMSPDKVNYALHGISERGEADFNQPPLSTMVIFGDSVITAEDLVV
ncbi:Uu.00g009840.m01.CDS01 [Anthostomella pinea]|uniref:Uu.00g009840.m01.CDS01 n=1 Tax=Anthostomella pinea TaxID=933095 RepID=A0AAI8VY34_9PEZI|nr:Uu.00g009840.m01.CDS01 [Anthostomella pinea]